MSYMYIFFIAEFLQKIQNAGEQKSRESGDTNYS